MVKLKRDKSNYVPWQRSIKEVLEAMGCEAAITKGFAKLTFYADDDDSSSSSSSEDSDDLPDKQTMFFASSWTKTSTTPTTTKSRRCIPNSNLSSLHLLHLSKHAASMHKESKKGTKKMKKRIKKEKKFQQQKKKIDAKARTAIRNSIDAKAFERSTYDCKTAYMSYG